MNIEERYPDIDIRITKICKMLFEDGYNDAVKQIADGLKYYYG